MQSPSLFFLHSTLYSRQQLSGKQSSQFEGESLDFSPHPHKKKELNFFISGFLYIFTSEHILLFIIYFHNLI